MRHYYVLNQNPHTPDILDFIISHDLTYELHFNRTRFWIPEGAILTNFLLRFSTQCLLVDDSLDLSTGLAK